jgi:hypothetical protein
VRAVLAEFETREALVRAARELRTRGWRELDAFLPYPAADVEEALGLRRSRLSFAAFAAGILGAGAAYATQWWCNARDYPLDVGGRPLESGIAWVPITFEMGILAAALTIVAGFAWAADLTRLDRPELETDGFERATIDRFWLAVAESNVKFDAAPELPRELAALGALRVVFPSEARP